MKALALGLVLSLLPNSDGWWLKDARYEACMAVVGESDWKCEFWAYGDPL